MEYDISLRDFKKIKKILSKNEFIATAPLPAKMFKTLFKEFKNNIINVPCSFFGGNIQVAGLLTRSDLKFIQNFKHGKIHTPENIFSGF